MSKMSQSKTDYGMRGETGEKMPKGAIASDASGEKRVKVPKADSEKGTTGQTGEKIPMAVKGKDSTGEKRVNIVGGVGMGKADSIGLRESGHMGKHDGHQGEVKGGSSESVVYDHKRVAHDQDGY